MVQGLYYSGWCYTGWYYTGWLYTNSDLTPVSKPNVSNSVLTLQFCSDVVGSVAVILLTGLCGPKIRPCRWTLVVVLLML